MYIWILLATIMVALSFFNTSPREDKASVFTEIKASTIANRFRAEHIAFFRGTECEMLYNDGAYNATSLPKEFTMDFSNEYTSIASNLPVGYEKQTLATHAVFCFDKDIGDSALMSNCSASSYKYAISFAQIPARWLSKEKMKIKYVQDDGTEVDEEIIMPLPNFINYLAKELSDVQNTGWMWCGHSGCHLVGRSTVQSRYEKVGKGSQLKYMKFTFPDSLAGKSGGYSKFLTECRAGVPCLFAFDKYRNSDTGLHCKAMKANKSS